MRLKMAKRLLVNGKNASDIFRAMVSLLMRWSQEHFGLSLSDGLSSENGKGLEDGLRKLAAVFHEYGVTLNWSMYNSGSSEAQPRKPPLTRRTAQLKDHRLLVHLPSSKQVLIVHFDYADPASLDLGPFPLE
tara:strand:+ start:201 stop:596 length:396 start_codon:yes stop_codon:yes gene_type:complete